MIKRTGDPKEETLLGIVQSYQRHSQRRQIESLGRIRIDHDKSTVRCRWTGNTAKQEPFRGEAQTIDIRPSFAIGTNRGSTSRVGIDADQEFRSSLAGQVGACKETTGPPGQSFHGTVTARVSLDPGIAGIGIEAGKVIALDNSIEMAFGIRGKSLAVAVGHLRKVLPRSCHRVQKKQFSRIGQTEKEFNGQGLKDKDAEKKN